MDRLVRGLKGEGRMLVRRSIVYVVVTSYAHRLMPNKNPYGGPCRTNLESSMDLVQSSIVGHRFYRHTAVKMNVKETEMGPLTRCATMTGCSLSTMTIVVTTSRGLFTVRSVLGSKCIIDSIMTVYFS